jgi:lysylphosphatidylglycerol synthetase-like protein (DUF2156 family)
MNKTKSSITKVALAVAMVLTAGIIALPGAAVYADCDDSEMSIGNGAGCAQGGDTPSTLFGSEGIFNTIVNVILFLVGAISVIMLIYGGIKYSISAGDTSKVTSAKNTIMYAIVGLVVSILAFAIVNFVIRSFGD